MSMCQYMTSMPQIYRIRMAETVVIPTLSEMIIPRETGEMPHMTRAIVEGNCQELCEGNVLVAHTLLNPSLSTLPVQVMNLSHEPLRLHAGTHIVNQCLMWSSHIQEVLHRIEVPSQSMCKTWWKQAETSPVFMRLILLNAFFLSLLIALLN